MKSVIFKRLIIVIAFITVFISPNRVYANAPDIVGGVYSSTEAPIPGATVVWTDNRGASRTVSTDGGGRFFFVSWQNSGQGSGFGCLESPHTWSVSGLSCSSITTSFGNVGSQLDIGNITCGPPPPPPPTATPIPTPTLTPTPTPPTPCTQQTSCPVYAPYCVVGIDGRNGFCGPYPTPTPGGLQSQGGRPTMPPPTYTPTPKVEFMEIKLGRE